MRAVALLLGAALAATTVSACSSGSSGGGSGGGGGDGTSAGDCARFCQKNAECNPSTPDAECMEACAGVRLSTACVDVSVAVDCAEFNKDLSDNPSWVDECFPSCTSPGQSCDGSWVTACTGGRQATASCSYVCSLSSLSYTGVCGPTHQGQSCPSGGECCWCE